MNIGLFSPKSIAQCCEYSEEPEKLKAWLESNPTLITCDVLPNQSAHAFSEGDDTPRLCYDITIGGYSFKFWDSIHNTEKWNGTPDSFAYKRCRTLFDQDKLKRRARQDRTNSRKKIQEGILYSVLSCIGSDYHCPGRFAEFCDDYGYNDDSIKDRELFERCDKHASELQRVLKEDVVELFPG